MTQPISKCTAVFQREYLESPTHCKLQAGHTGPHAGVWHTTGTIEWIGGEEQR